MITIELTRTDIGGGIDHSIICFDRDEVNKTTDYKWRKDVYNNDGSVDDAGFRKYAYTRGHEDMSDLTYQQVLSTGSWVQV